MPFDVLEIFRSVEIIWGLWILSLGGFVVLLRSTLRRLSWRRLRRCSTNETGAAYTLSLVMVVPIYLLLLASIVETTLVLSAKCGTIYAAYHASRAGVVWSSAADPATADAKMRQAAIEAMLPFVSGTQNRSAGTPESAAARRYLDAYEEYATDPADRAYLAAKYRFAEQAVSVTHDGPPAQWHSDLKVVVRYNFPFNVPGVGRLLGEQAADGNYYYPIQSAAQLQNEGPKNETQRTGIRYASPE